MEEFPQQHELIEFFESEPKLLDEDIEEWIYNTLTFSISRNNNTIICIISPSYSHMKLSWTQGEKEIIYLDLNLIQSIKIQKEKDTETMLVEFDESESLTILRLRLKPDIHMFWGVEAK
jgi:hypothetical protein